MRWQDTVFTAGSIIFIIALIPSIVGKDKPAIVTSFGNAMVLAIFTIAFASLSLWFSAVAESIVALGWLILGFQKLSQQQRERK